MFSIFSIYLSNVVMLHDSYDERAPVIDVAWHKPHPSETFRVSDGHQESKILEAEKLFEFRGVQKFSISDVSRRGVREHKKIVKNNFLFRKITGIFLHPNLENRRFSMALKDVRPWGNERLFKLRLIKNPAFLNAVKDSRPWGSSRSGASFFWYILQLQ